MKVLTIGSAMHDIFMQYDYTGTVYVYADNKRQTFVMFEEGRKIEIENLKHHVGGGALNSATAFARLGNTICSFFKTGTDAEHEFIRKKLEHEGIDIAYSVQATDTPTGNSFVLPCESGDRTILVYRGANLTITSEELPREAIEDADLVYITPLGGTTSDLLPEIASLAKEHNKMVAITPGSSQLTKHVDTLKQALPHIDLMILNCSEAQQLMDALMGCPIKKQISEKDEAVHMPSLLRTSVRPRESYFTLPQFFKMILSHGPKHVVVTNGKEGVYATDGTQIYFCPSVKTNVISTLGAGDAFGSTFTSYLGNGNPLEKALYAGVNNSASVLLHLDAQTGLLTRKQMDEKLASMELAQIQAFPL